MCDRRGHKDGARRLDGNAGCIKSHLAAALLDQENLEKIAMPMGPDRPVVDRRTRCNRLDVNEIGGLIIRRIAIKVK